MNLNNKLKQNRYGPYNIQVPKRQDIIDSGIVATKLRAPLHDIQDTVFYTFRFPPIRDKFYLHYIYTVDLFLNNRSLTSEHSRWQSNSDLIDHHLAAKLLYFELNPQQCGGSFYDYAQSWIYNALYAMRSYNIRQAHIRGELQSRSTRLLYEPLPKPMGRKATLALADKLYDIVYPRVEIIRKKSKLDVLRTG